MGASFLSAFLLFLLQPLIAKMILPLFGGVPAVWNTCQLFFQAALLAGYGYSFYVTTRLSVRRQVACHLVVLLDGLARVKGLHGLSQLETAAGLAKADVARGKSASYWVVLARRPEALSHLAADPHWTRCRSPRRAPFGPTTIRTCSAFCGSVDRVARHIERIRARSGAAGALSV